MNRSETHTVGVVDRNRSKASATARTLQVRSDAIEAVNAFVMAVPEEDRPEAMNAAIRHLRTLYGAGEGDETAVALFGSLAFSKTLTVNRAIASARAEQLFAPKAANDREGT